MKKAAAVFLLLFALFDISSAFASDKEVAALFNETKSDFAFIKEKFARSYKAGYGSWRDVQMSTGYQIQGFYKGLSDRKKKIDALKNKIGQQMVRGEDYNKGEVLLKLEALQNSLFNLIQDYNAALGNSSKKGAAIQTEGEISRDLKEFINWNK